MKDVLVERKLRTLCIKYRRVLSYEVVHELDTLLGIVWNGYCSTDDSPGRVAEAGADEAMQHDHDERVAMLIEELRLVYDSLLDYGVTKDVARQMLWQREKVSRLQVRDNGVISLVDFGIDVRLTPMQWALYVLFLRYKDGLAYKQLPDYRNELMEIMMQHYGEEKLVNTARVERMLANLTDPMQGKINEVVSKIRKSFRDALSSDSAYIYGGRNSLHRIALEREFVDFGFVGAKR